VFGSTQIHSTQHAEPAVLLGFSVK